MTALLHLDASARTTSHSSRLAHTFATTWREACPSGAYRRVG
jgi:FMN-dependent NADH-azoreductase